ncbi:MAG: prolyl oligopeptidase family serine peptidase [Bacteroidota bacterium]|nr:prolyl oligopeptidase family serine peptidase [Bacteroidota bacterium]
MAFKDWGYFPYIGEKLAQANYCSIVLNYSHNGVEERRNRITNLEMFAANTVSLELVDIRNVIDSITDGNLEEFCIDTENIFLLGHSRGGANALLIASSDNRIKKLVTWASIAYYDRWTAHQKNNWRQSGFLSLSKETESHPIRMKIDYLEDLEKNKDKFDLYKAASRINIPWLIVHGTEDLIAKISEAEKLFDLSADAQTQLVKIPKVGHLFGTEVPTNENNNSLNNILQLTINWLHNISRR